MKTKVLSALLCLALLCTLCACGKSSREDHLGLNDAVVSHTTVDPYGATPTPSPTPVPTPPPTMTVMPTLPIRTPTPMPTVTTPLPTIRPAVAPTPTTPLVNVDTTTPKITKHPTSEIVDEGGKALFVARADYAKTLSWSLVSPDLQITYDLNNTWTWQNQFQGLEVKGTNGETLTLDKIPYSLNGWHPRCTFTNASGKQVVSDMATVTVNKLDPQMQLAKTLSERCLSDVTRYGQVYTYSVPKGIQDYTYYAEKGYAEFNISLVNGAVELKGLFRANPGQNTYYPVSMMWMAAGSCQNIYWYETLADNARWNQYIQDINDIAAYYGVGTAGSGGIRVTPAPQYYVTPTPPIYWPVPGTPVPTMPVQTPSSGGVIVIG